MTEIKKAFALIEKELEKRAEKVYNYLKEYITTDDMNTRVIVHNVLYNGHVCTGRKKENTAQGYLNFLQSVADTLSPERDLMTLTEMTEFCNAEALMVKLITTYHDGSENTLTKIIIF